MKTFNFSNKQISDSLKNSKLNLDIPIKMPSFLSDSNINLDNNLLQQIEKNQKEEISRLIDLNNKKDIEIKELKISSQKEKKRFWWTYIITTGIAIIGIILGIIF